MQIMISNLRSLEYFGRAGHAAQCSHIFTLNLFLDVDHYTWLSWSGLVSEEAILSCKPHAVCYVQKYDVTLISPRNYFMCDSRAPISQSQLYCHIVRKGNPPNMKLAVTMLARGAQTA